MNLKMKNVVYVLQKVNIYTNVNVKMISIIIHYVLGNKDFFLSFKN